MDPTALPLTGWIFDMYPTSGGMVVWIVDAEGRSHRLVDPFQPAFYAAGPLPELRALARGLARLGLARAVGMTKRREFWSGDPIEVLELRLLDPERQHVLLRHLAEPRPGLTLYDCDLHLPLLYCHARGIFPLARCEARRAADGTWAYTLHDDAWALAYAQPPLTIMRLRGEGDELGKGAPFGTLRTLEVRCDETHVRVEEGDPAALIAELNRLIHRFDPHVLLTEHGDAYLIPTLLALARRAQIPLDLDREAVRRRITTKGRSFFSYGRILYQAPSYPLFGRWHLDRLNSFFVHETGLEGLWELARLSKLPVQKLARTSPGTAISAMQLDRALETGILVPWKKGEPERWKSAWDLFVSDKGGLVYQPPLGLFEHVAEIDFASMYPAMMVRHNISPETVGCACCPDALAPEIGTALCRRREGLVTRTLRPILERRAQLKALKRASTGVQRDRYEMRQTALKWILVTCFGYLGYRNARFGRIEAHEAVTAWGREVLLQARELAEAEGYRVVHAIVDSLWVQRDGATDADLEQLCAKIGARTGIPISLEGVYKWIAFLPSRTNPLASVANRFVGAFASGELKVRGIDLRRSDTPPLVREAQERMLAVLAEAPNAQGFKARVPMVLEILAEYALKLWTGDLALEDLVIRKGVSKEAGEYRKDTLSALASRELAHRGIAVHPGESVAYIITDADAPAKGERMRPFPLATPDTPYDVEKYLEFLLKATETILHPVGYDRPWLARYLGLVRRQEASRGRGSSRASGGG